MRKVKRKLLNIPKQVIFGAVIKFIIFIVNNENYKILLINVFTYLRGL